MLLTKTVAFYCAYFHRMHTKQHVSTEITHILKSAATLELYTLGPNFAHFMAAVLPLIDSQWQGYNFADVGEKAQMSGSFQTARPALAQG